ncbi:MAG: malto-oligosyltrehalose synthase [Actinobacteria bacterium]|nr:malto-oligosyltrehalose synthase [Actinomycetota bacterium]
MPTPSATYRLQLHPGFTFDDGATVSIYLADLGVSHAYASPSFDAVPGSPHGYDVVDPTAVNDELGGEAAHARWVESLTQEGLAWVLDIVPNHLAASRHNRWWWDVLRHGPASRYASVFDIDWLRSDDAPPQIVLPVLGAPLDEVAASGELTLDRSGDEPVLRYHEHAFPVAPGSLDLAEEGLLELLARQHYRLVHWRRANHELNYRRFFDITTLLGVRVEDPQVFELTHHRVLAWLERGELDGIRIDHPDGLRDPVGYLRQIREAAPDAWIIVEKIVEEGEPPRTDWPVDGTVGYEFCNLVLRLFVDPTAEGALAELVREVVGEHEPYVDTLAAAKREAIDTLFGAELSRLVGLAVSAAPDRNAQSVRAALIELLVAFPVYRTYVTPERGEITDTDREIIAVARTAASAQRPDLADELTWLADTLTLSGTDAPELVARFQQLTGPVMAKGAEDTAFYRDLRLLALNEVGGDPGHFGVSVAEFHTANERRQRSRPGTMLTTSTHDTKRSEDVRARLAVLSESAGRWATTVNRWVERNAHHHRDKLPDRHAEYLLYQTMVGAWPLTRERLHAYVTKALREAKRQTSWLDPDEVYESAVHDFVDAVLDDEAFVADLERFVDTIAAPGHLNSLSQTLLRLTSPGVPDTYQGCELWDLSLVDPDNRRPVDFDLRRRLLTQLATDPSPGKILARMDVGLPKLHVVQQALRLRRQHPSAFDHRGSYRSIEVRGERGEHLVAFQRGGDVVVLAPRLVVALGGDFEDWSWGDTSLELPDGRWRDHLTGAQVDGGRIGVANLLARFPVGLLVKEGGA